MTETGVGANLIASVKQLLQTVLSILENRLALLATEVGEARSLALILVFLALLGALFLGMALFLLVLFVVALFWDSYRLLSIGLLLIGFAIAGGIAWMAAARKARSARELFSGTRSELARDREELSRRSA